MAITLNHEYLTAGTYTVNLYNGGAQTVNLQSRNPNSFSVPVGYSQELEINLSQNTSFTTLNTSNFGTVIALNVQNTAVQTNNTNLSNFTADSIYEMNWSSTPSTTADFSTLGCTNLVSLTMSSCPNLTSVKLGPLVTTIPYNCVIQLQDNPNLTNITFNTTNSMTQLDFRFTGNQLSQSAIDSLFQVWAAANKFNNLIDVRGQNPIHGPSAQGLIYVSQLQSNGWTVLYDTEPTTTTTTTSTTTTSTTTTSTTTTSTTTTSTTTTSTTTTTTTTTTTPAPGLIAIFYGKQNLSNN
jgi:hypothetical protein